MSAIDQEPPISPTSPEVNSLSFTSASHSPFTLNASVFPAQVAVRWVLLLVSASWLEYRQSTRGMNSPLEYFQME